MQGTQQIRQQERREQKLRDIRDQIDSGKLVVREMTDEERARYMTGPAAEMPAKRRR